MSDKKLRLQLILDAGGGASKFLRGVAGDSDKASRALKGAAERVADLNAQSRNVSGYKRLGVELTQTREKLAAAQAEAQRLGLAHAKAEKPTKSLSRALEIAKGKVNDLKDAEVRQGVALQTLRGKLEAVGVSTRNLERHEARLARETRAATAELKKQDGVAKALAARQQRIEAARGRNTQAQAFAGSAQGAGMSAIGAGVVVGAPLVLAARQAMSFEEAMADVRKVVNFPTPAAFRAMSNDILSLSDRLPVAKEELAAIMALGARAGVPRAELLAFTEQAAKMGVAFDISSEEAGSMMATWRTAFGLQQSGVITLANQVNALTNSYGGNAAAVADMVTRVGPLADVAGASSGVLAALSQVMNSVGVESEIGATGIKNMLLGMTKGESATKAQSKAFKALGLDASVMARRMQTDAGGAIMTVLEAVSGLSKDRQLSVLGQLFGTESVAAISPMLSQLDLVRRNFREVGDAQFYAGSMDKEFASRAETTTNGLRLMKNNASALAVEFGSGLLPAIRAGSKWIGSMAVGVRDFSAAHPTAMKVVAGLVAVLAGALFIFGGLAVAVAAILGPFALASLAMTTLGISTGIALWPVLAVVAGIAVLAGLAVLLFKNWKPISAFFGGLWNGVKAVVGAGVAGLRNYIMNFTPLGIIIRNWSGIVGFVGAVFRMVGQAVGLGFDLVKLYFMRFTPLGMIVRNWGPITGFVSRLWNQVQTGVSTAIAAISSVITSWSPLVALQAAFASAFAWLTNLPGRFLKAGTDIVNGLTRGIQSGRAGVQAATADAGRAAETGVRVQTQTRSPSRVFAAVGRDLMSGMAVGIRSGAGGPLARMRTAAAALVAAGAVTASPAFAFDPGRAGSSPTFDTGPRLAGGAGSSAVASSGRSSGSGGGPSFGSVTIQIYQLPGESADDLARKVAQILQQPNLSRLGDERESWGEV